MKLDLSPADKKLLDAISNPENLTPQLPRLDTVLEGVKEKTDLYSNFSGRGRFTGAAGFDPRFGIQHVCFIPASIAAAMLVVDPDILNDKRKFYAWLKGPGKNYDLRGQKSGPMRKDPACPASLPSHPSQTKSKRPASSTSTLRLVQSGVRASTTE